MQGFFIAQAVAYQVFNLVDRLYFNSHNPRKIKELVNFCPPQNSVQKQVINSNTPANLASSKAPKWHVLYKTKKDKTEKEEKKKKQNSSNFASCDFFEKEKFGEGKGLLSRRGFRIIGFDKLQFSISHFFVEVHNGTLPTYPIVESVASYALVRSD